MRIRDLRKAKGITQGQLAATLNVRQSTVAMWETNQRDPQTSMLPRLAKALGCRIDDLFEEMDEQADEVNAVVSGEAEGYANVLPWKAPTVEEDDGDMSWLHE